MHPQGESQSKEQRRHESTRKTDATSLEVLGLKCNQNCCDENTKATCVKRCVSRTNDRTTKILTVFFSRLAGRGCCGVGTMMGGEGGYTVCPV